MVFRVLGCAALLTGCSFILPFSAEGQPCDDAGACLPDFVCRGGQCVRPTDAGASSDGGGGTGGSGGCQCSATQQCVGGVCYEKNCAAGTCATGAVCEGGRCVALACVGQFCDGGICVAGACEPASCSGIPCAAGQACRGGLCVDVACVGLSCSGTQRCAGGACVACVMGAAEFGADCTNGLDDDCDGKIDCQDTGCVGQSCTDGSRCTTGDTCRADGGCVGTPVVCADAGVAGSCAGNFCDPATGLCSNRVLTNGTACGTSGASRCCDGGCVDIGADRTNCGGCGISCGQGTCVATSSLCGLGAEAPSGRCQCMDQVVPCVRPGMTCQAFTSLGVSFCVPDAGSTTTCAPGQHVAVVGTCPATCAY